MNACACAWVLVYQQVCIVVVFCVHYTNLQHFIGQSVSSDLDKAIAFKVSKEDGLTHRHSC